MINMKKTIEKTIYYTDPLNDEFSEAVIEPIKIDGDYVYLRKGAKAAFLRFFWYRTFGRLLAKIFLKSKFRHKIVGREKLKPYKKKPYFLYGNHTQAMADPMIPVFVISPKSMGIIVHPNNVSIPHIGKTLPYLGALPLPGDVESTKHFSHAIETKVKNGEAIVIYPEAHIWPYYTGIRPFVDTSFVYPAQYGTPVFCFTNTYHKRKNPNKVKIITYIDGPFFPKEERTLREKRADLREQCYQAMVERAKLSDRELIHYLPKEESK